jgi:hypothetical protein
MPSSAGDQCLRHDNHMPGGGGGCIGSSGTGTLQYSWWVEQEPVVGVMAWAVGSLAAASSTRWGWGVFLGGGGVR